MLGIDGDAKENNAQVLQWKTKEGMKYPMISGKEGTGGAIFKAFKNSHFPTIHLISPDKKIVEKGIENKNPKQLLALLDKHIEPTFSKNKNNQSFHSHPIRVIGRTKFAITVSISQNNKYGFILYSIKGKKINLSNQVYLEKGIYSIPVTGSKGIQKGIYVLEIQSNSLCIREKVIF